MKYNDYLQYDEEEEYFKRPYFTKEIPSKLKILLEYYKYHKDISRLFMLPVTDSLNRYNDQKRRIEYKRITKLIKSEYEKKHRKKGKNSKKESKNSKSQKKSQ